MLCTGVNTDSNDIIAQHSLDDKPKSYVCTVCEKRFTTKVGLKYHLRSHSGKDVFTCTQCEKRFAYHGNLMTYMNIHSSKYRCSECGKNCQNNRDLTRHRQTHSGEKPFECNVCSKQFKQSANLVKHSKIHSGEKPYKCHVCDKAFNDRGNLVSHMRVHTMPCV